MPMPFGTLAALIAGIVLVNAVFVAAEFALLGAPRAAIEHRAGTGDGLARRLLAILGSAPQQDQYIATSQLGITVASLALGMFAEHEVALWLEARLHFPDLPRLITVHGVAAVAAVAVLTFVHIVVGEMVPKSLAPKAWRGSCTGPCAWRSPSPIRSSRRCACSARHVSHWWASAGSTTCTSSSTRPRNCGSSSRRASAAALCAARLVTFSKSSSSSAI
jgi:hypothetical protein